jgi:hypothetical protein
MVEIGSATRGKPAWRDAMRRLPVGEKLALLEKAITEALALERLKSEWRKSAKGQQVAAVAGKR